MSKLLTHVHSQLVRLRALLRALGRKRLVILIGALLVLLALVAVANHLKTTTPAHHDVIGRAPAPVNQTAVLTASLSAIQVKLSEVQQRLSQPASSTINAQVKTTLAGVMSNLSQLQTSNQQHYQALHQQVGELASTIASNQHDTVKQLTAIEKLNRHQTCLSADHLPFTVRAIDWINGQAVVSVAYNHSVVPLETHLTLAGWQLTHSDYEHQTAQFTNAKGVCAAVQLQGDFA